ncbi:MAG TPA: hypothetical protein VHL53_06645 [Acidimicrobiia bacterium]|nr:hypothetical protein [Acidimicrobiia bacterium]
MTALARYQAALLLRSQRWLVPVLFYAAVLAAGSNGHEPLGDSLAWSAAMAVPAVAWLTRNVLGNEPPAARACLAAAGGARRSQLSALLVALAGGLLMVAAGTVFEVLMSASPTGSPGPGPVTVAGFAAGVVCVVAGTAVAAVANPPVVRRPGSAALATVTLVILALASNGSPAAAAIRQAAPVRGARFPVVPALISLPAAAAAWAASVILAARRT